MQKKTPQFGKFFEFEYPKGGAAIRRNDRSAGNFLNLNHYFHQLFSRGSSISVNTICERAHPCGSAI